jgi:hypothetical protein
MKRWNGFIRFVFNFIIRTVCLMIIIHNGFDRELMKNTDHLLNYQSCPFSCAKEDLLHANPNAIDVAKFLVKGNLNLKLKHTLKSNNYVTINYNKLYLYL